MPTLRTTSSGLGESGPVRVEVGGDWYTDGVRIKMIETVGNGHRCFYTDPFSVSVGQVDENKSLPGDLIRFSSDQLHHMRALYLALAEYFGDEMPEAASAKHLEDMRKIVGHKLGVTL